MTDPNELVSEFHKTYGMPINDAPPSLNNTRTQMRVDLVAEEFFEFIDALYGDKESTELKFAYENWIKRRSPRNGDVVETADAMADMVYVLYGMALELGIPLNAVLEEVQRSNMSKLPPCEDCSGEGFVDMQVDKDAHVASFNMCRTCEGTGDGPPLLREDGKILKGPNYSPPDIAKVLVPDDEKDES